MSTSTHVYEPAGAARALETFAAWLLGVLWVLPLLYAVWTAFHPAAWSTRFSLGANSRNSDGASFGAEAFVA
jgi:sn-glycerol 3-phosphate transport system permease protein